MAMTQEERDALDAQWEAGRYDRELAELRTKRDQLIAECDWTQLPDTAISSTTRTQWAVYRQALRDITEGFTTLDAVVWPTKP